MKLQKANFPPFSDILNFSLSHTLIQIRTHRSCFVSAIVVVTIVAGSDSSPEAATSTKWRHLTVASWTSFRLFCKLWSCVKLQQFFFSVCVLLRRMKEFSSRAGKVIWKLPNFPPSRVGNRTFLSMLNARITFVTLKKETVYSSARGVGGVWNILTPLLPGLVIEGFGFNHGFCGDNIVETGGVRVSILEMYL